MPRRAENFEMLIDYRRNTCSPAWFPSVITCYLPQKTPIFLIPPGFRIFLARRNKVQTHPPPPSPLRILIVPVSAARRISRSMKGAQLGQLTLEICWWGTAGCRSSKDSWLQWDKPNRGPDEPRGQFSFFWHSGISLFWDSKPWQPQNSIPAPGQRGSGRPNRLFCSRNVLSIHFFRKSNQRNPSEKSTEIPFQTLSIRE